MKHSPARSVVFDSNLYSYHLDWVVKSIRHFFTFSFGPHGVRFFKWERTYTVVSRAFDQFLDKPSQDKFSYLFVMILIPASVTHIELLQLCLVWRLTSTLEASIPWARGIYTAFICHRSAFAFFFLSDRDLALFVAGTAHLFESSWRGQICFPPHFD
ncbi:hypothetical protein IW262DRAFT_135074 [Armillaria fumosa]|nr:hypothetical protein IW262DRAFT_135074 [Armillaria fumosa]